MGEVIDIAKNVTAVWKPNLLNLQCVSKVKIQNL